MTDPVAVYDTKAGVRLGIYERGKAERQVKLLNSSKTEPNRYEIRPWPLEKTEPPSE